MFPDAKISCAHDFGQAPLDPGCYPTFVSFVGHYVSTRWGHISIVHAEMRALRELYEKEDPDWFVLMSGSDYPVVAADIILSELKTSPYDAYLDFREVTSVPSSLENRDVPHGFDRPRWVPLAYNRYIATRPSHPFGSNLRCFGGDNWFTANRRVARVLLDEYENGDRLIKHFSECMIPDEAFYQTVICNQPGLCVSRDNKRYADWSSGEWHPKFLDVDDLPAIAASRAHFARKFQPGAQVLSLLDRVIDQK